MIRKKRKYKFFQDKIKQNSKNIRVPQITDQYKKSTIDINNDLNINITDFKHNIIRKNLNLRHDKLNNEAIKTTKYKLLPTNDQKIIFQKWLDSYIEMYNLIIQKIKNMFRDELRKNSKSKLVDMDFKLNINDLKKEFAADKLRIQTKSNINMHILDYAITDALAMYKSKVSNLKNGHIRKSRLRYLKKTKGTKIFKIENYLCKDNSFCVSELGSLIKTVPEINFKEKITIVGIIQYNNKTNEYNLLVRERIMDENDIIIDKINNQLTIYEKRLKILNDHLKLINSADKTSKNIPLIKKQLEITNKCKRLLNFKKINRNEQRFKEIKPENTDPISMDPGIRKFLTGLSNKHIIEIGTNIFNIIVRHLNFIDKVANNNELYELKKKKLIAKTWKKIKNKVNDYHWKIINYLVNNYGHIIIGNFSTKSMCETDIGPIIKRVGSNLRFYVFKQRLQYKCYLNGIKYTEIDEYCTSKCCSNCGNFKKNLGPNKTYNCIKCKLVIDRDINAAKNILMKTIK